MQLDYSLIVTTSFIINNVKNIKQNINKHIRKYTTKPRSIFCFFLF